MGLVEWTRRVYHETNRPAHHHPSARRTREGVTMTHNRLWMVLDEDSERYHTGTMDECYAYIKGFEDGSYPSNDGPPYLFATTADGDMEAR